ncbi:MAG: YaaA family protein, partial [Shimia sp.]
ADLDYAQDHLRILSGLYGVLRPRDAIQPYRLEMGSRLKTRRGKNLYEYWRDAPAKALREQAEEVGAEAVVNCASQEYFGAVDPSALKLPVFTPVFREEKEGTAKIVSFFAKRARGAMARFIVQNRVTTVDGIKAFDLEGYSFKAREGDALIFQRPYPT